MYQINQFDNNQYIECTESKNNNIQKMNECHLCRLITNQTSQQAPIFMATCCIKRCFKKFCLNCINTKFDEKFQQSLYKSDTWICYSCQNKCECVLCKGIGSDKKSNKKRTGQLSSKQQIRLDTIKQQNIEEYHNQQQLNSATPFMKKIYQRRNQMFKLMANASQKINMVPKSTTNLSQRQSIMPKSQTCLKEEQIFGGKSLKQIIKKTLKNYQQDDDDIELID